MKPVTPNDEYDVIHEKYSSELKDILFGVYRGYKFRNDRFEQDEEQIKIPTKLDDHERYAMLMDLLAKVRREAGQGKQ